MTKIKVKKQVRRIAYSEFWHSFEWLKYLADKKEVGEGPLKLAALILAAFSLEAYVNHIGEKLFPSFWKHMERNVTPMGKVHLIMDKTGVSLNSGERPLQTVDQLMKWRNSVAHGTSLILNSESLVDSMEDLKKPEKMILAKWEEFVNEAELTRIHEDLEIVMRKIFDASGIDDEDLFEMSSSTTQTTFQAKIKISPNTLEKS